MTDLLTLAGLLLAGNVVLFTLAYLVSRRLGNYGVVDVVWSLAFTPAVITAALLGNGDPGRRLLVAVLVSGWSLRLGTHLGRRVLGHLDKEDGRYGALRQRWSHNFNALMYGFFLLQAASVVVLSLPLLLAVQASAAFPAPSDYAAVLLWVLALAGESTADRQLRRFKAEPANAGKVCDRGLWSLCRHPNYLCEFLCWVAFALTALATPWGVVGFVAPAAMLFLLLRMTGIPETEAHLLRTRGEAYEAYRRRTPALFPRLPWLTRTSR